jgi:hypothetical protein
MINCILNNNNNPDIKLNRSTFKKLNNLKYQHEPGRPPGLERAGRQIPVLGCEK